MTLNTPLVYSINAFDPAYPHTFEFSYTGTQCTSNRAIIVDNETQAQVYNAVQIGLKLDHIVPANTLKVGHQYLIQIQVYDADGNSSNLSSGVLFYCYTTPQFYFSNVNNGDTITTANLELQLAYTQSENEELNEYKYYLYDMSKVLTYTSESFFTQDDLRHTLYGLQNNYIYYVRAIGTTVHGMSLDTGIIEISVRYINVSSDVGFTATNDSKTGCVVLRSTIVSIDYILDKENDYSFTDDGMVDIKGNTLSYKVTLDGDFVIVVKAKRLPLGDFLWTTDKSIVLSIDNILGKYYAHLKVSNGVVNYNIFKTIIDGILVASDEKNIITSDESYISIVGGNEYSSETLATFEIHRKNNIYDLVASYE